MFKNFLNQAKKFLRTPSVRRAEAEWPSSVDNFESVINAERGQRASEAARINQANNAATNYEIVKETIDAFNGRPPKVVTSFNPQRISRSEADTINQAASASSGQSSAEEVGIDFLKNTPEAVRKRAERSANRASSRVLSEEEKNAIINERKSRLQRKREQEWEQQAERERPRSSAQQKEADRMFQVSAAQQAEKERLAQVERDKIAGISSRRTNALNQQADSILGQTNPQIDNMVSSEVTARQTRINNLRTNHEAKKPVLEPRKSGESIRKFRARKHEHNEKMKQWNERRKRINQIESSNNESSARSRLEANNPEYGVMQDAQTVANRVKESINTIESNTSIIQQAIKEKQAAKASMKGTGWLSQLRSKLSFKGYQGSLERQGMRQTRMDAQAIIAKQDEVISTSRGLINEARSSLNSLEKNMSGAQQELSALKAGFSGQQIKANRAFGRGNTFDQNVSRGGSGAGVNKDGASTSTAGTAGEEAKNIKKQMDENGWEKGSGYFAAGDRLKKEWKTGKRIMEDGSKVDVNKFGVAMDYMFGGTAGQIAARAGAGVAGVVGVNKLFFDN